MIFFDRDIGRILVNAKTKVFTLDGNLEIGANAWRKICNLKCLKNLFGSIAARNTFFFKRLVFLHTCASSSGLPVKLSTKDQIVDVQFPSPLYLLLKLLPGDDQFANGIENVHREWILAQWSLQAHFLIDYVPILYQCPF